MWVKICGIRDVETALWVAELGADAIGLNFYERSPRVVEPSVAAEIVDELPDQVTPVGLFVNASLAQIQEIMQVCPLDWLQLHGDEPPEFLAELAEQLWPVSIIRAFRVGAEGLDEMNAYLERCRSLSVPLQACLVDARVEGVYGGSGQHAPWDLLRADERPADWPPLILAGGLQPENVRAAIEAVRPWGVDVAGGVESALACKDPARVRQFIHEARST